MDRVSKHAALLLMGFFAIAAQILLIRELLISFSGNELSIGIFLANWLLLEAAGSFSAAHLAKRIKSAVAGFSTAACRNFSSDRIFCPDDQILVCPAAFRNGFPAADSNFLLSASCAGGTD